MSDQHTGGSDEPSESAVCSVPGAQVTDSLLDEVKSAFWRYEYALRANDIETLNDSFMPGDKTTRYGVNEIQNGFEAIEKWRRECPPVPAGRVLGDTQFLLLSDDSVLVNTLFQYHGKPGLGRQTQLWVRYGDGLKILFAHVSECMKDRDPSTESDFALKVRQST